MKFNDYETEHIALYREFCHTVRDILEKAIAAAHLPRPQSMQWRAKDPKKLKARLEQQGELESDGIESLRRDLATGKSLPHCHRSPRLPLHLKIFRFAITPNQRYNLRVPSRQRGVSRSSRTLGWNAVDAGALRARMFRRAGRSIGFVSGTSAQDERRFCVRRSRVVLTPVAGAKSAGGFSFRPTGRDKPSIHGRR
jgi:hypothetical protein